MEALVRLLQQEVGVAELYLHIHTFMYLVITLKEGARKQTTPKNMTSTKITCGVFLVGFGGCRFFFFAGILSAKNLICFMS